MKTLLPVVLFCLNVCPLLAQSDQPIVPVITELRTLSGKSFEGITSIKAEPNKLRIIHSAGAATVRLDALDETTRRIFHYDPAQSAAADKRDAAAEKEQSTAIQSEDAQLAAMADAEIRKQNAIKLLKSKNFGGHYYWQSRQYERINRDTEAHRILKEAGVAEPEASRIIARLKQDGKSAPAPALHPEFTRPQGQLRGVPDGTHLKK